MKLPVAISVDEAPFDISINQQVYNAMASAGITPPNNIIWDGEIHRFKDGGKNKNGWYVVFPGPLAAGAFGNWAKDITVQWRDLNVSATEYDRSEINALIAAAKKKNQERQEANHKKAAIKCQALWDSLSDADPNHPYLVRKKIDPIEIKQSNNRLVVPVYGADGIISLQYIDQDGSKRFHPGGETKCGYNALGTLTSNQAELIYLCEGYATAATIYNQTGVPTLMSFSASNLPNVAKIAKRCAKRVVIVADNDESGVGEKYARQADGCEVILIPIVGMDANDYQGAGNSLLTLLGDNKPPLPWLLPAFDFFSQPESINFLIKGWIQKNALMMIVGASGCGKTFIVLDWVFRITHEIEEWGNNKVKPGLVAYLAGEGHIGLKTRGAAWYTYHNLQPNGNLVISRSGCDIDTEGGLTQVINALDEIPFKPDLIVLDTLHRFMDGDENKATDTKKVLSSCAFLMSKYNCSVLLVHHTGHGESAQDRGRGSSAWKGALDTKFLVKRDPDSNHIELSILKAKDFEPSQSVILELIPIEIPGWYDEDDEQVRSVVPVVVENNEQTSSQDQAPSVFIQVDTKLEAKRRKWERAWIRNNKPVLDGKPYVTRDQLMDYLVNAEDHISINTAKKEVQSGQPNRIIGSLLGAKYIQEVENGWVMIGINGSALMMTK